MHTESMTARWFDLQAAEMAVAICTLANNLGTLTTAGGHANGTKHTTLSTETTSWFQRAYVDLCRA